MPLELVEAAMPDGLRLYGALHTADRAAPQAQSTAALLLHGTGSNFYGSSLWAGLIPRMLEWGLAALAVNTRGHDGVSACRGLPSQRFIGSAYEQVDQCRLDVAGWLDWLLGRGFQRVVLVGHSLGAVKALYSLAAAGHPAVAATIALSPPRLNHEQFSTGPRGPGFLEEYARMAALVASGGGETLVEVRFPLPYLVTAAGYVDKYGPAARYDLLKLVEHLACPLLITYGTVEVQQGMAFRGVPEALAQLPSHGEHFEVQLVAGADHIYSGCHSELAARLGKWLEAVIR
ncbi:MAG TPA: alpha/beta fold hydrolase [Pirellulales bacterium]